MGIRALRASFVEGFEELVRMPDAPTPPWGSASSVRVIRPGRGYVKMRRWRWALSHLFALAAILFGIFGINLIDLGRLTHFLHMVIMPFEVLALILFPFGAALSFVLLHLDIRYRWYLLTDRSLRIREGLWTVREMTISLANLQHVGLRQGPLERWFGVANVEVRTAGGGDKEPGADHTASMHIGLLRGVEEADALRDEIVARWQQAQAPDTEEASTTELSQEPLASLRTAGAVLVDEARALGDWARRRQLAGSAVDVPAVEVANVGTPNEGQRGP